MSGTDKTARACALVAAVMSCLGTMVVGAQWPRYSPVRQTVSTLAAVGAPTRAAMNTVLLVTVVALLGLTLALPGAGALGRCFLLAASVGVLAAVFSPFPAPDVDTAPHTASVTVAMVMLGLAPLAACAPWRRTCWPLPLRLAVPVTACLVAMGLTFLWHWLHDSPVMGAVERVFIAAEMVWLVWAVATATAGTGVAAPTRTSDEEILVAR